MYSVKGASQPRLTSCISSGTEESIRRNNRFRRGPACLPRMLVATPPASAKARWLESSFRQSFRKLWCSLQNKESPLTEAFLSNLVCPSFPGTAFLYKWGSLFDLTAENTNRGILPQSPSGPCPTFRVHAIVETEISKCSLQKGLVLLNQKS